MSDHEPIAFRPRSGASLDGSSSLHKPATPAVIAFDRRELGQILTVYGRMVAAGEWRDYAMDFGREQAVFSVFRRSANGRSTGSRKRRKTPVNRALLASSPQPA